MGNKWKGASIFLLIIAIAAFFRLYSLKTIPPGLYPDEAMNGNNALEALATGEFKVFYPENNGREGLFINIQAAFLKFLIPPKGSPEPWMLRLPSAFFGILTVVGLFLFAKTFLNYKTSLFASFLTATSFWHINFSRIGFRAIMAPFFLVWAIYLLILSFKSNRRSKSLILAILGGAFYGLGFYSYIAYRATPILILLILIFFWLKNKEKAERHKILLAFFCFLAATIIVILPFMLYFINNPADFFGRTTQVSIFSSRAPLKDLGLNILKTTGMFNVSGDYNWRHNIAGKPLLFLPVGIFFLTGLFFSIKNFKKNFILPSWLITAALPVVISNESLPHALRSILMAPPVFVLSAIGGVRIYGWLSQKMNKKLLSVTCCLLFVVLIIESYSSYFFVWGKNQEVKNAFSANYVEIGHELNSVPQEMPKYVVVEPDGVMARGLPIPAQTVMFITNTFLRQNQIKKNIYYVLPENKDKIPNGSFVVNL